MYLCEYLWYLSVSVVKLCSSGVHVSVSVHTRFLSQCWLFMSSRVRKSLFSLSFSDFSWRIFTSLSWIYKNSISLQYLLVCRIFFRMQKDNHQLQWHIKTNNTKRLINWILIVNTKKEIKDLQYQIKLKSIFYNHLTLSKERNICIVGFCTSFLYSVQHLELIKDMTFLP